MPNQTRIVICCGGCEPKCGNCGIPVEVEMTDEEVAAEAEFRAKLDEQVKAEKAAEAAYKALRESARAKLVAGEPLTEEEAATIVL
jgi:hypothetical protein